MFPTPNQQPAQAPNAANTPPAAFATHTLLFLLAAVLNQITTAPAASAAQVTPDSVQIQSLQVGFQGTGQVGRWLPLKISATGLPPGQEISLVVAAPDPRGDQCESLAAKNTTDSSGNLLIEGVFATGRLEASLQLRLLTNSGQILWTHDLNSAEDSPTNTPQNPAPDTLPTQLNLLRQSPLVALAVGQPAGLSELENKLATDPATRGILKVLRIPSLEQLPNHHRGLDCVDVLLLSGPWNLKHSQADAIREWVLAGGHLALSCSTDADALLTSPLGPWIQPKFDIPASANTLQTLDLTAIQNYVLGATALQTNRNPVTVLRMPSSQAKILVQSLSDPLIARTTAGTGIITLTAVNLNARPLDNWLSLPQLYEMLLFGEPQGGNVEQSRSGGRIASVGITDLSTQLAAVSDALPDSQRWSTWHIMLLMALLLALVGPLDYFLVVRILKTPRLTWITLPLLIAAGCSLAALASQNQRGDFIVRQTELLDVFSDAGEPRVRARSWASLSARESSYVKVATTNADWLQNPTTKNDSRSVMWSGRVEDIYGGMYRPGGAGLGQLVSRRTDSNPSEFTALPLLADGSTALLTDKHSHSPNQQPLIHSQLKLPPSALLEGSFTHHLPDKITNWIVVCGNRIYSPSDRAPEHIRELEPGEAWSRDAGGIRVLEIRDFLRGVRLASNPAKNPAQNKPTVSQLAQAWDVNNRNPLDILLMTSLYEAAGGRSFVQLKNDALRRDELSDSISLNTALLIGLMPRQLSEVLVNDQPVATEQAATIVRLFLPVQPTAAGRPTAEPTEQTP